MPEEKVKFGDIVKHTISELVGTVVGICYYFNGCTQ